METIALQAKPRIVSGKQVSQLREKGILPAVVYGHGVDTRSIEVEAGVFEKVLKKAGESSLVDLTVDGAATVRVLIQEVQRDPLLSRVTHIDFREVNMKEKLEATIQLRFIGESPAVKGLGAILVRNLTEVKVRCLPDALVHEIDVDLTGLKAFGDHLKVSDIKVPEGIEMLSDENDSVVVINEPISEAELAAMDAKPVEDVTQVKVAEKEKKADDETEEKK